MSLLCHPVCLAADHTHYILYTLVKYKQNIKFISDILEKAGVLKFMEKEGYNFYRAGTDPAPKGRPR